MQTKIALVLFAAVIYQDTQIFLTGTSAEPFVLVHSFSTKWQIPTFIDTEPHFVGKAKYAH